MKMMVDDGDMADEADNVDGNLMIALMVTLISVMLLLILTCFCG